MVISKQNIRLIFGLKLKQLRQQRGLSFADLSKAAGVSVSYLNEIEKGKKYPKTEKIIALAEALDVSYDQLVSLKLNKKLAPIADLLNSGILESLPLELFGLDPGTVLELITNAPTRINAFISTLVKIARNYEMSQENFYFAALRSYQEMHDNYFEDLETAVDRFAETYHLDTQPPLQSVDLLRVLTDTYGYQIDRQRLNQHAELRQFRSVYAPQSRTLYISDSLTAMQKSFLLGKELAFNYLGMEERPTTSNLFQVHSFEEVLNNFKASYFSVALLMNRHEVLRDLTHFFDRQDWSPSAFLDIMHKYRATPEMFFHRISNLLPRYFDIDNFFFLRLNDDLRRDRDHLTISKELHFSRLHNPHRNDLNEHYCRRWVSVRILEALREHTATDERASDYLIDVQRSQYIGTPNEYLCISIARPNTPTPHTHVSVTLGIQVDATSRKRIRFIDHPAIRTQEVNKTCERCPLADCAERSAAPSVVQKQAEDAQILTRLQALIEH